MDAEKMKRLEQLKNKHRQDSLQKMIQQEKQRFADWIPNFELDFEFVSICEHKTIDEFINRLSFSAPARIDMTCFSEAINYSALSSIPDQHQTFYCICLMGNEITIDLYTKSKLESITKTYDDWERLSPYLLLIADDFSKIIFIDDNGEITHAKAESIAR